MKQGTKEDARSLKDTLAQGWDELTHGGGKAPYATTQGEGSPQDVTSNVERSKNLSDPGEKKVYEAETYKVNSVASGLWCGRLGRVLRALLVLCCSRPKTPRPQMTTILPVMSVVLLVLRQNCCLLKLVVVLLLVVLVA